MSSRTGERARGGTAGQAMPRGAAPKSRGDKSRSVTVAPLPQVAVDIIPGRFTEDDWMSMVMTEDGEDVVGDLVDALMDRVMEECLMVHLQHQVDKSRSVTVAPLPQVGVDIIPGRFTEDDWMSIVTTEDGEDVVGDLVDALMDRVMEECLVVHLQHQVDKSRSVTVAPLPQVGVDIIPGRFTEDDWMSIVTTEDGEDVVGDLVDALMDRVMEECLVVHLQHQLIPYTVSEARDAMVQMVQWTFVPRDEGDEEPDIGSSGKEEPQPCPHDSWAQGCVPVTQPASTPRYSQPQVLSPITDIEEEEEKAPQAEEPLGAEEDPPVSLQEQIPTPRAEPDTSAPPAPQPIIQPTPPTVPPKTKPRYRPHRGPLRSAGVKEITKSLEETEREMLVEQLVREESFVDENVLLLPTSLHNILKIQLGRPPQKKDVIYDHDGNVLSMPKVELSRLPQRHVRPRVEVLDVGRESENSDIQRGGRQLHKRRSRISSSSCDPPQMFTSQRTCVMEDSPGQATMSSVILLDTMPLTHGVILREGDRTERGSVYSLQKREHHTKRRELRPIQASIPAPSLRVEQLIKNNVPQVQPLVSFLSH